MEYLFDIEFEKYKIYTIYFPQYNIHEVIKKE